MIEAAHELGPAIFGSLLIITLAFLPVFTLEAQEGRLFKPLAYMKTFSIAFACLLSITLVPALMVTFVRGRIRPEMKNSINRLLISAYRPTLRILVRARYVVALVVLALLLVTIYPWSRLGSEFMPPLDEGSILFMPITVPGISKVGFYFARKAPPSTLESVSGRAARNGQARARGRLVLKNDLTIWALNPWRTPTDGSFEVSAVRPDGARRT